MTEEDNELEKGKSPFRPAAVEHFGDTSQFEQHLQPIQYKRWLTLISLALLIMGILIRVFFGFLPIEAQGVGDCSQYRRVIQCGNFI